MILLIAAALTPAFVELRKNFVMQFGQEPSESQKQEMQNAVLNEWVRTTRALAGRLEQPLV